MPSITSIVSQNYHHPLMRSKVINPFWTRPPVSSFNLSPFNRTRKTLNISQKGHTPALVEVLLNTESERETRSATELLFNLLASSTPPFSPLTYVKILQGGENGEAPPEQGGFMGGIMGKANALKAKAAETAAAAGAGNLQVSQPRSLRSLFWGSQGQPFLRRSQF